MDAKERQKKNNARAREKRTKTTRLAHELDALEARLEALPVCVRCARERLVSALHFRCDHTPERRHAEQDSALCRAQLAEVDH